MVLSVFSTDSGPGYGPHSGPYSDIPLTIVPPPTHPTHLLLPGLLPPPTLLLQSFPQSRSAEVIVGGLFSFVPWVIVEGAKQPSPGS